MSLDESKYKVLLSPDDSLNLYHVMKNTNQTNQIYSNPVNVDIVQDNVPVLCKIYIGDRIQPSIQFHIEEVSLWRHDTASPKHKD